MLSVYQKRKSSKAKKPVKSQFTSKTISKKRANKDKRNKHYRAEYIKNLAQDESLMQDDEAEMSKTQQKKILRLQRLELIKQSNKPSQNMHYESKNGGTTLGGPDSY